MKSERNTLAGSPSNKLVRDVRRVLYLYVRCKPRRDDRLWLDTWEWAAAIAGRNSLFGLVKGAKPKRWPSPSEIASQFLFLALVEMRDSRQLGLPFRATEVVPPRVQERFASLIGTGKGTITSKYTGDLSNLLTRSPSPKDSNR